MATPVATLLAKIKADTTDFDEKAKGMGGKLEGIGRQIAGAFSFAAIATFSAKALQAFDEQEKAVGKVESALATMGTVGVGTIDDLTRQASQLQSTSLFGDEEILNKVTAQMLTFGNVTGDVFGRAQQAALDMASHLGTDLQGAAIQVGKALNDPIKGVSALAEVGVSFTQTQKDTIKALVDGGDAASAQAIILSELENQYGGTASAMASLGMGPVQQLKNSLGDLMEIFGKVIAEAVLPLADGLGDLVAWFQGLDVKTQEMTATFAIVTAALGALALAFGWIPAAVAAVVASALWLRSNWDDVVFYLKEAWLSFKLSFLLAATDLAVGFESMINSMLPVLKPLARLMGIELPDQITVMSDALRGMAAEAGTDLGTLRKAHNDTKAAAEADAEAARLAGEQIAALGTTSTTAATGVRAVGGAADDSATKLDTLKTRIDDEFKPALAGIADATADARTKSKKEYDQMVDDLGFSIDLSKAKIREIPAAWTEAAADAAAEVEPQGAWGLMLGSLNNFFRDTGDNIADIFNAEGGVWGAITGPDGLSGLIHDIADSGLSGAFSGFVDSIVGTQSGTVASAVRSVQSLLSGNAGLGETIRGLFLGRDAPLAEFTSAIINDIGGAIRDLFTGDGSPMAGLRGAWENLKGVLGGDDGIGATIAALGPKIASLASAVAPFAVAVAGVYTFWEAISGIMSGILGGASGTYDPPPGTGGVPLPELPGGYELPGGTGGGGYPNPFDTSNSSNLTVVVEIDGEAVGTALVNNIKQLNG